MSSVQKKTTRTTKTVTTKKTQHVQTSSDQSADVQSAIAQKTNNLSIVQKGQFFNDSYFEDTRQDFQDAVQDVLAKWGDKSKPTNDINSYRDLRARDLRDENQAIKSTEDQRYHKIVVDVQDFIKGGEVSVKTLDEVEIVVEGRVQRKVGNTTSTKSFKRTFILPDIEPESITSVVSADGILIIKALKKVSEADVSQSVTVQKTVVKKQQTSTVEASGQQDVKQTAVTVQDTQPAVASPQPEQQKTVTVTKTTTTDKSSRPLPIVQKGGFFEDTFFEDCRQHYQNAVKQVLQKCNVTSTETDDLTTYRNLRQKDLREENQVATVDEEEKFQKIIVDVKDFLSGGEVTVKTVEEREVVIEGHIEKQEGNKKTTKRFCKRFILPEDILVESVTSVVSSDGVLTVTAPRKPSEGQDVDVSQSVTVQKTVVKKQQTSTVEASGQQDVKQIAVTVQDTQPAVASPQPEQQKTVTVTKTTTTDKSSRPLPIAQKGGFFEDTFFEDCRQHYQNAVKQVLQKCNVTSTETDDLTTYRNLRQKDLREENQVATVDESTDVHKIIVDVKDFLNGGEVTVKTVEEREVVIEGHIEKQEGNKKTTKRFCKRFILPEDIVVESVTSVVSSDGVLTVTARKKVVDSTAETVEITKKKVISTVQSQQQVTDKSSEVDTTEKKTPTDTQVKITKTKTTKTVTITTTKVPFFNDPTFVEDVKDFQEAITTIIKKMNLTVTETDAFNAYRNRRKINPRNENQAISEKDTDTTKKIVMDVCDFIGGVTVKVDEHILTVEGRGNRHTEGGGVQTFSFNRQFILPDDVNPDDITAVMTTEGILIITIIRKKTVTSSVVTKEATQVTQVKKDTTEVKEVDTKKTTIEEPQKVPTQKDDTQKTTTTTTTKTTKTVTITTKGPFFNDPTFVEDVKDFQEAITTIIKKLNLTVTETDVFTTYRNYRKTNPKNENQAVADKETDNTRKIVIDVCDFVGNVTVKVVEHELVIEGEGQRPTETGTIQTFRFNRRYSLPEDVNPDDITAVMSSEGILIITIIRRIVKVTQVKKDTTDVKQIDTKKTTTEKDDTQQAKTTTITTKTTKTVTITTSKTPFFNEPTFVEDVKDFQEAITTIIKKLNLTITETDVFTSYRNHRKINPRNENQAVSEKETDTTKKIVMDVCDFIGGVTVKVDEHILTVEGKGNRHTEGGGVQTFSFNRQFILPDDVNPDDITAVMTTEGILIITIIRKKTVTSSVVTKEETQVTQVKKDTTEVKEVDTKKTTIEEPKKAPILEQPKPTPAPEEPKPAPAPEQPKPAPAPEEPKPAPAPEEPKPAPAPEQPKPTPAPEEPKPAPAPEQPKPAPAPEEPKPAPAPEQPKPAPAPEEPKPAPAPEQPKPAPAPEQPKPAPAPEQPKPAPAPEEPKPAPAPEEPKPAPAPEQPKPAPAPEEPKPAPAPEQPKPAPAPEEPKPAPAPEQPKPAPAPEQPKPAPAPEQPKPAPAPEQPKPAPAPEEPKPAPAPEQPKPAPAPEEPKPAPAPEQPKPAPAPEEPKPAPAPEQPKPAPAPEEAKKAPILEEPKPTPAPEEPKKAPAPEEPKKTPAPEEPKKTPAPEEPKKTVTEKDDTQKTTTTTTTTKTTKTVTITTSKTPFFKEPTFVEDVKDFQEAITTIIKKLNLTVTEDIFTTYRNYRKTNPKNENQAVADKETDNTRKIVIDVCDFVGNVTVKVVERELVIEGEGQRPTETGTVQTFRFNRRFGLPEDVNPDDITAVISSEGILIITIIRRIVKVTQVKKDTTDVKQIDTKKTTTEKDDTQKTTTTTTTTKTTKTVTITTKGPFFNDPTFVENVKDFQEAITTIIKKLNLTVTEKDVFTTYRNYRKTNPKNENQAVADKETDTTRKIVIDVCDFVGNVTVKVVERELVIEGEGQRPTETGTVQTFRFNRRFSLPEDVNPDDITAVMSSEGILIITIIRRIVKVTQVKKDTTDVKQIDTKKTTTEKDDTQKTKTTTITTKTTKTVTITTKGPFFNDPTFVEDVKDFQEAITTIIKKLNLTVTEKDVFTTYRNYRKTNPKNENQAVADKETDTTRKIVIDVCDFVGNVTVKVVERELVIEGEGQRPTETGTVQTFRFNRRFGLPEDVNPDDITAVMSSEGILIITIIRRIVKVTQVKKDTTDVKQIDTKKTTTEKKDETQKTKTTTTTTKTTKTVTITTKGPFFKDPTFVEDVKNYDQAITTVIKKFNLKIEKDAYTTYRNYRKSNPKNENQAVSEKETDKTKKIVIDVCDFSESVTARVEERDLVIEGEGKRKTTTGAIQTFSFNRHFCLPEGATTDDITAVKSAEGILSVSIKKTVTSSVTTTTTQEESTSSSTIKITVKGPFFSDPAFANSIKEFQSSITTVIKKFNVKVTGGDAFTAYRNYRKENPKNENQAVSVNETETVKKVVMDVCDFVGAVTAKVEGKEVVVSGTGKRQKGGKGPVITFSFGRRFSLYDNTIIEGITAVMSSEGILTLTIPRKQ